jgi:hypothetical protein
MEFAGPVEVMMKDETVKPVVRVLHIVEAMGPSVIFWQCYPRRSCHEAARFSGRRDILTLIGHLQTKLED